MQRTSIFATTRQTSAETLRAATLKATIARTPGATTPGSRRAQDTERNQAERDRVDGAAEAGRAPTTEHANGLVSDPESFRRRWESVQVGFVDDPRQAVGDADALVSSVIDDLAEGFRRQRQRLESRWSEGEDASTDDLRESFQRYRDFFERLLQV